MSNFLLLLLGFIATMLGLGAIMPLSSSFATTENVTDLSVLFNNTRLTSDEASEAQLPKGVPYVVHLSYQNGSFLSTGPVDYSINFDFGEPFIISALRKGTFENATLVGNSTVKFHGGPIAKGENKTGVLLFSFKDGLADKHRVANVTTNVTVHSLPETIRNRGLDTELIFSNSTGTFANASLFTNESVFTALTGTEPTPVISSFVNGLPVNSVRSGLSNLSLSEIAGTFNVLPASSANLLINSVPPIAPSATVSNSSSFLVNSSYIDLISSIVNLTNGILDLGQRAYTETTPCLSLGSIEFFEPQPIPGASVYKFGLNITNCSNHFELVKLSTEDPVSTQRVLENSKFDMVSNETRKVHLYTLIPDTTAPGFYVIDIQGNALWSGFGLEAIVAETLGQSPFVVPGRP